MWFDTIQTCTQTQALFIHYMLYNLIIMIKSIDYGITFWTTVRLYVVASIH